MLKKHAIVIGDLHHQVKEPKCFQVPLLMNELIEKLDLTNPENILIFAGDLVEKVSDPHNLLGYYNDLFTNTFKDNQIIIVEGNHDRNLETDIMDVFKPLKNVTVIAQETVMTLEQTNWLLLPHYDHENTKLEPMHIFYTKLHEKYADKVFDFGVAHVDDEQQPGKYKKCDLSKLNVNQWLSGHIHRETVTKGGRILGASILNSLAESGKTPLVARVNLNTKRHEFIKVTKFLEYYDVIFPEPLPQKLHTQYGIFTVTESLNKKETSDYYSKMAEKNGYTFYARKIISKKIKQEFDLEHKKSERRKDSEYFIDFKKQSKLNERVSGIIEVIIKKKENV